MIRQYLSLLTILSFHFSGITQEFAFIQNADGYDSAEKISTGYKFATCQKVFNDLLRARGEFRMQAPQLVMANKERFVAWMDPNQVQIGIEEKAYDICTSFGPDSIAALAALIAHELTHYYEKHDWNKHFARENEQIETTKQLERLDEGLKHEAQADYLGGFLAFSAGYNTYGIMPKLLPKLYQAYSLPEKLEGYPSLTERIAMVESAMLRLKEMEVVFEVAQLLSVVREYQTASAYYQNILKSYQSCEIYNNTGVNTALAALDYFSPSEMPYFLPLEFDPNTRLRGMRSVDAARIEKRNSLLKLAEQQFSQAILLDENYALSYLNKACVLILLGEHDEASFLLKKALKKSKDPVLNTDIMVLEGISAAIQGNMEDATSQLEKAKAKGGRLADANLKVVQKTPTTDLKDANPVVGVEQIEQYKLADFLANPSVDQEISVSESIFCGIKKRTQSRIFIHYANNGKEYAVVQETDPSYAGLTLKGIKLKSPSSAVLSAYGPPRSSVQFLNTTVWVYPEANIYFKIDTQNVVAAWGVYVKL
jgi:tetratricopeptide (TPR) repeat protein